MCISVFVFFKYLHRATQPSPASTIRTFFITNFLLISSHSPFPVPNFHIYLDAA